MQNENMPEEEERGISVVDFIKGLNLLGYRLTIRDKKPKEDKMRYSMHIQWSDEDNVYLVTLPEWANVNSGGPHTHGDTYEEAVRNGMECLDMLIDGCQEDGEELPEPDVYISDDRSSDAKDDQDETKHTSHDGSTEEDTRGQGRTEETKDIS